ncbi:hypothetical protein HYY72_05095 [Candidatus Woesearchaeota archaeon]|nr:hypothetical protein [Candidatus Woesearchaeota archaeon]
MNKSVAAPEKQMPKIYSLFCSDSRMDSSLLVANPANHMFVTRNIGNQAIGSIGSVDYPISHLDSIKLAMVIGHLNCGAVAAAYNSSRSLNPESAGNDFDAIVSKTLEKAKGLRKAYIHSEGEDAISEELAPMSMFFSNAAHIIGNDEHQFLPRHAAANVHFQIACMLEIGELRTKVEQGKLVLGGAIYDLFGRYGPVGSLYLININGNRDIGKTSILDSIRPRLRAPSYPMKF